MTSKVKDSKLTIWGSTISDIILFTLLMALPAGYEPNHFAKALFLGAFIQSLSLSLVLVWLSRRYHVIRTLTSIILLSLFSVETFVFLMFGSRFNPNILTLIIQTTPQESSEFVETFMLHPKPLLLLAALVLLCSFVLKNEKFKIIPDFKISKVIFYSLSVLIICLGLFIPYAHLPFPIGNNTIKELYYSTQFIRTNKNEIKLMEQMIDEIEINPLPEKGSFPTIVLIIGESHNKHHSRLYGYSLPTSEILEKEHSAGRLSLFSDVWTPTNGTNYAMRFLFTLKRCQDKGDEPLSCVLMPAVFKKAGYKVAYFDNQYTRSKGGELDYGCSYFLNPSYINENCFDYRNNELFNFDGDFIASQKNHFLKSGKSLNIIHLMGQHFDAAKRYPENYGVFDSDDIKRMDLNHKERKRVAEYDNAVRYNDYVISSIIEEFKNSDAVIIYLSDHGEQIYDGAEKLFGRQFSSLKDKETLRNVYQIPFFIWCSDTYMQLHADKFHAIQNATDKHFCLADVPYLLFDLGSIEFSEEQKEYSLISPEFREHEIILN